MAFPTTLDTFPSAATLAAETLATEPHSTLHDNLGIAIAALEAKVGITSSAVTTSLDYQIAHLGTASSHATAFFLQTANNLSDVTASTARTNLGLGSAATHATTDYDAAGAATTALNTAEAFTTSSITALSLGTASTHTTAFFLQTANNLSDVTASTARTNLGLGSAATANTGTGAGAVPTGGVITAGGPTGDASHVAQVTYNAAGQVTAVSSVAIALAGSAITSGTVPIGQLPTGTTSSTVPLGGVITAAGPQGDASHTQVLTWNAAGQVTAVTNTAIALAGSAITSGTVPIGQLPTGTSSSTVPLGGVITGAGPQGDAAHTQVLTFNNAGQLTAVTNTAIAVAASAITSGQVAVANGGTNASTASAAKTNLTVGYATRTWARLSLR